MKVSAGNKQFVSGGKNAVKAKPPGGTAGGRPTHGGPVRLSTGPKGKKY